MRLHFAEFTFDTESAELRLADRVVPLASQPARVLGLLLENAGHLVTRETIRAAIWADRIIDFEQGINASIRDIRRVLGDESDAPRFVATLPKKGYRFISPVREARAEHASPAPAYRLTRRPALRALVAAGAVAILLAPFIPSTTDRAQDMDSDTRDMPTAALEHYQAGRMWLSRNAPEAQKQAVDRLQQAATLAPGEADVWAALALAWLRYPGRPQQVAPLAESAATLALSLEPRHSEALLALANVAFHYDWDWMKARKFYRAAVEANPRNAGAHQGYGSFLIVVGETDAGLRELERAYALAPLSTVLQSDMSWFLDALGHPREALAWCDRLKAVAPDDPVAVGCTYRPSLTLGDFSGAAAAAREVMRHRGASNEWIARMDPRHPEIALAAYREWRREELFGSHEVSSFDWARVEADEGHVEQAIRRLRDAIAERDPLVPLVPLFPEFRALAAHPSFREVMELIQKGRMTRRSVKCLMPSAAPIVQASTT